MKTQTKSAVFRFRCDAELAAKFQAIADRQRRVPSDLARIVLEDYVSAEETKPDFVRDVPRISYRAKSGRK